MSHRSKVDVLTCIFMAMTISELLHTLFTQIIYLTYLDLVTQLTDEDRYRK